MVFTFFLPVRQAETVRPHHCPLHFAPFHPFPLASNFENAREGTNSLYNSLCDVRLILVALSRFSVHLFCGSSCLCVGDKPTNSNQRNSPCVVPSSRGAVCEAALLCRRVFLEVPDPVATHVQVGVHGLVRSVPVSYRNML